MQNEELKAGTNKRANLGIKVASVGKYAAASKGESCMRKTRSYTIRGLTKFLPTNVNMNRLTRRFGNG